MKAELLPYVIIISVILIAGLAMSNCVSVSGLNGIVKQKSNPLDEKKIRKDPVARVTKLLRKVFG